MGIPDRAIFILSIFVSLVSTISEKLRKSPVGVYSLPLYVTGIYASER